MSFPFSRGFAQTLVDAASRQSMALTTAAQLRNETKLNG